MINQLVIIGLNTDNTLELNELLDKLSELLNADVSVIEVKLRKPIINEAWYREPLPPRVKLKALRNTTLWRDTKREKFHSVILEGYTGLEYWGAVDNGMAAVYLSDSLSLWVWADDVRPV